MSSYGPTDDDREESPPRHRNRGRSRSYSPSPPPRRRGSRSRSPRRHRDRSYSPDRRRSRHYRDYPPPRHYDDRYRGDPFGYHHPPPPYHHHPPPPYHHPHHPPPHHPPPPHHHPNDMLHHRGREDRPGPPPGRRDGRRRDEGPPGVSLLIRNVSTEATTDDLKHAFGRIGDIKDVYIPRDFHSRQPKGFAFIEYANPALAAEARDEMNEFVIKGQALEVVFAQERRKTPNEMRGRVVNQQNHRPRSSSFERQQRERQDGEAIKKEDSL